MNSPREKIDRVGGIDIAVYRGDSLQFLSDYLASRHSGIVLLNENSMIDTRRIDDSDNGLVGPQVVDLEAMTGSIRVLRVVKTMIENPRCIFLPGTLLRDFGGYSLPVIPVIRNGKLEIERVKTTGLAYVDDYRKLAEKLFGKDYAENYVSFSGASWKEPLKSLLDRLNIEVAKKRRQSYLPLDINGLCVAPVICNELGDFVNQYKGKQIDIICHSASNLLSRESDRSSYYCEMLEKLASRGKLNYPIVLGISEEIENKNGFSGLFTYDNGKLEQLNLKG